jgi:hypothetical protein
MALVSCLAGPAGLAGWLASLDLGQRTLEHLPVPILNGLSLSYMSMFVITLKSHSHVSSTCIPILLLI